jgi:DNA-binding NtrC family response regulator
VSHELSLQCYLDAKKDPELDEFNYRDLKALLEYFGASGTGSSRTPLPDRFTFVESPPQLLIVEDEESLSEILGQKLVLWGYPEEAIQFFSAGDEAISYLKGHPVSIALVDIRLTNPRSLRGAYTSGLEVIRELRDFSPQARVFLMSGFSTYGMVRKALLDMGVSYFLRKPFKLADVLGVIHWASEQIALEVPGSHGNDKESVLVVDDDNALADGLGIALRSFGYRANVVNGGVEALDALERYTYDAVLLDLKMPDVDGMEVLRQIKQRDQQPVVLVLSAVADQAIATNAMSLGAHEFLLKPCDLNILQFTLEHALIRKSSG